MRNSCEYIQNTIVLCGPPDCGKSKTLRKFRFGEQEKLNFAKTKELVEFRTKTLELRNKTFKLSLWDITVGANFDKRISDVYFKKAHVLIYFFDITDINSFIATKEILEPYADLNCPKILVGANSESPVERVVSVKEAKKYAKENGMAYIEVSAEKGKNVQLLFEGAVTLANKDQVSNNVDDLSESIEWPCSEESDSMLDTVSLGLLAEESSSAIGDDALCQQKKAAFERMMSYADLLSRLDIEKCSKNDNYAGRKKGEFIKQYFPTNGDLGSKQAVEMMLKNNSNNILNNRNNTGIKWYKVRSFFFGKRNKYQGNRLCESKTEELLVDCLNSFKG